MHHAGLDGGIHGFSTEVVKVRQTATNGVVKRHVFLNWREGVPPPVKFTQMGWADMLVPEGMAKKDIDMQILSSNFPGLHRTKEGIYPQKWNILRDIRMALAVKANILLNQEMFSSKTKESERFREGFSVGQVET